MSSSFVAFDQFDVRGLARAVAQNTSPDALDFGYTPAQWEILSGYMQPFSVQTGQVLMSQGDNDRTFYLIESGTVSVHYEDEKARIRLAMVGAGSVVGESSFFSHKPRSATVQASGAGVLWRMNPMRFAELSNRQPAVALQMVMSLAGVLARRLKDRPRRIAAT